MDIDSIFSPSNLDENKKKAKKIFGKLLVSLRKQNYIKLYSLLDSISDTNIVGNDIVLTFSDNTSSEMLKNDLGTLQSILKTIDSGLGIKLNSNTNGFDKLQFEKFLKEQFGKILTII